MCGRFTRKYSWRELWELYTLHGGLLTSNVQPRYNVCPTTTIDTIVETNGQRQYVPMRWSLIPAWWSKPIKEMKMATFNVRAETVESKPMFRSAWKAKKRCIIPVSGYYEWQAIPKDKPQPWYFTRKDSSPIISVAGIWDEWTDKHSGETLKSCAMIITEPNNFVAEVHDRMPVLLNEKQFEPWLSGNAGKETLLPAPEDYLQKWRVSKRVNSSRTSDEDATLIDKIPVVAT